MATKEELQAQVAVLEQELYHYRKVERENIIIDLCKTLLEEGVIDVARLQTTLTLHVETFGEFHNHDIHKLMEVLEDTNGNTTLVSEELIEEYLQEQMDVFKIPSKICDYIDYDLMITQLRDSLPTYEITMDYEHALFYEVRANEWVDE